MDGHHHNKIGPIGWDPASCFALIIQVFSQPNTFPLVLSAMLPIYLTFLCLLKLGSTALHLDHKFYISFRRLILPPPFGFYLTPLFYLCSLASGFVSLDAYDHRGLIYIVLLNTFSSVLWLRFGYEFELEEPSLGYLLFASGSWILVRLFVHAFTSLFPLQAPTGSFAWWSDYIEGLLYVIPLPPRINPTFEYYYRLGFREVYASKPLFQGMVKLSDMLVSKETSVGSRKGSRPACPTCSKGK